MYRLFYVSVSEFFIHASEVNELVKSSAARNNENDITGMLCFTGTHFGQIIEGPRAAVLQLYNNILADPRHRDCIVISEGTMTRRVCQDWGMRRVGGRNLGLLTDILLRGHEAEYQDKYPRAE